MVSEYKFLCAQINLCTHKFICPDTKYFKRVFKKKRY